MVSSLQKAAATSSSSTTNDGRRSNGKIGRTETSFEVSSPVVRHPIDADRGAKTQTPSAYTIGAKHSTSSKKITNTQHFTIIADHYEQQRDNFEADMDVDNHHEVNHGSMDVEDTTWISSGLDNPHSSAPSTTRTQTFLKIGEFHDERKIDSENNISLTCDNDNDDRVLEQMEGVIDQGSKLPLVVLDGANVAYAYASVMTGTSRSSINAASSINGKRKVEPDVRGIQIASDFFVDNGIRVLVVLPQYFFGRNKNYNRSLTKTMTVIPQSEILSDLKERGLIVASPPTDDDDAYALTIARREENRSCKPPRNGEGPGFVLSNDLFRDAQERDSPHGTLKEWLTRGRNVTVGPGRISYTFGDMGTLNDRGERVLDFIPNPKHPLIVWMENQGK